MPNTDHDPMDPSFEWRLKAALDRVTPPASRARYESVSMGGVRPWRVAPVLLAAGAAILLALTATAATGSPNPVVWTQHAASTIGSVGHAPQASPTPEPASEQSQPPPRSAASAPPTHEPEHETSPSPEPSDHPEESPRPRPVASPTPTDDHSGSGSGSGSPNPSPSPDDH